MSTVQLSLERGKLSRRGAWLMLTKLRLGLATPSPTNVRQTVKYSKAPMLLNAIREGQRKIHKLLLSLADS